MNRKKLFLIGLLIVLGNLALASSAGTVAETALPVCTMLPQAGKMMIDMEGPGTWTAIQFGTAFCETPVVVASPGENTGIVRIGVVTPSVAWVFTRADEGQDAVIFWQAMPATQ